MFNDNFKYKFEKGRKAYILQQNVTKCHEKSLYGLKFFNLSIDVNVKTLLI